MFYYKLKSTKKGFEVIGTAKRIGKDKNEFLYLTKDEIDRLSPDALIGYEPSEDNIVT